MSSKAKAAPKAGAKKPIKVATPAAKSSPGGSGSGTPASGGGIGSIPSFEDAMNAAPESFSASNLVRDCKATSSILERCILSILNCVTGRRSLAAFAR